MKILLVSEFTGLGSTGYSNYYKEIAKSLHGAGHDVIELASYGDNNNPEHIAYKRTCPWKVILNIPLKSHEVDFKRFEEREKASGDAKFGSWAFEVIVAQEHPDIVISVRDHWYDKFIIDSPYSKYYVSVLSPTVDSCFTAGTPILCKNDVKNIEDIIIGDQVLTHTGEYKSVLQTFKNKNNKEIYELRANNFSIPINLTADHPVWIISREKDKYTKDWKSRVHRSNYHKIENAKFINASKIQKNDYLVIPTPRLNVDVNKIDITDFIFNREYYEKNNQIYSLNTSQKLNKFITINNDTLGLFGLYIAEGSASTSFSIAMNQETEQEYLRFSEEVLLKYFNIKAYRVARDYESTEEVRANCRLLEEAFNNMFGKGCYNKIIPDFIFNLPVKKLIPFLEKLFIGDGCDTHSPHKKRVISYVTVSKKLAIQIFYLLLKCGCLSSISNRNNTYYVSLNGIHCKKLANLFNWESEYDNTGLKNDKSWIDEHGNAIVPVKYCKKIQSSEKYVYNFETEEHHTYCTGFVVHNCPQKGDWLNTFGKADIITTYNKWSENWLRQQYSCHNLVEFISPSAADEFKILDKSKCRKELGIPLDIKLVGTVMRNQRRKRFPELFEAVSKCDDVYLYCHTAYPDKGWDIPSLLIQNNIAHKTYITYMCDQCKKVVAKLFSTRCPACEVCGAKMETPSARAGVDNNMLCKIYNTMDLYIQPHIAEGFGIPVIEAAKCGIRVISTNYSAQEDIIPKVGGIPLEPLHLETEIETGCKRAVVDPVKLAELISDEKNYRYSNTDIQNIYNSNYSWDKTGKKWVDLVNSIKPKNNWNLTPDVQESMSYNALTKLNLPNSEYVLTCILYVAKDPKLIGSHLHTELLDGLNAGMVILQQDDGLILPIDRKFVYNRLRQIRENINTWENQRIKIRNLHLQKSKK